ncbi:hypothetical protein NU09_3447 [Flavobacterium beibuense]|uniref:Uncharacterized protein n=1 Tax=Flavobacterium beibuense TaxID=657326 RepID=A0A444W3C3_9FLAO|nr:hypothetical protein NU09_3447 [Flavobacterium beibuense]
MATADGRGVGHPGIDGHNIRRGVHIHRRVRYRVNCILCILKGLIVGNTVVRRVLRSQYLRIKDTKVKDMHTVVVPVIITGRQYRVCRGVGHCCLLHQELHRCRYGTTALDVLYPYKDILWRAYVVVLVRQCRARIKGSLVKVEPYKVIIRICILTQYLRDVAA